MSRRKREQASQNQLVTLLQALRKLLLGKSDLDLKPVLTALIAPAGAVATKSHAQTSKTKKQPKLNSSQKPPFKAAATQKQEPPRQPQASMQPGFCNVVPRDRSLPLYDVTEDRVVTLHVIRTRQGVA